MNQQSYNIPDAPAQRVIEDVMFALSSLKDNDGTVIFNTVLPTNQYGITKGLESLMPMALVYFGEEANGYNSAFQFDEMYFYPFLEICFILHIPNNSDGTFPDVQRMQLALHQLVIKNLRVPTQDVLTGIPYQKNGATGKLLWQFNTTDGGDLRHVVSHNFGVRNKWIERGQTVESWFHLSSIRMQVQVNNVNAE